MSMVLLTPSFAIQTKGPGGEITICNTMWAKVQTVGPGAPPVPSVQVSIDQQQDRFVHKLDIC